MKKSKRYVNDFINHLFGVYNVQRIPIHIHWYNDIVVTESGSGFGVYISSRDGSGKEIHVACLQAKTAGTLYTIAHEFVHYMQELHGAEYSEQSEHDADYWANGLLGQYIINKKHKNEHCYGVAPIWEHAPSKAE